MNTKEYRTALLDRPQFEQSIAQVPAELPLTVAKLDLDHFKNLNDELGHAAGDRVLRFIERILTGSLPGDSLIARFGGDEYVVALADTTTETALILLDEVLQHFKDTVGTLGLPAHVRPGLSVGLAQRPAHAQALPDLLRAADEALLRAKREGRGRIAIYVEGKMVLKSNYYPKASLERLSKLSGALGRTEASLLREALDELTDRYAQHL